MRYLGPLSPKRYSRSFSAGGAAKSPLWSQIVADVTGKPVKVPVVKEATVHDDIHLALQDEEILFHDIVVMGLEVLAGTEPHQGEVHPGAFHQVLGPAFAEAVFFFIYKSVEEGVERTVKWDREFLPDESLRPVYGRLYED